MAQSTLDLILRSKKTGDGEKQATTGLKGLSSAFQSATGISLGAAAAFGAVVGALKFSIDAASEAQRVMALTESTIKATGGAAGFTAEQIAALSLEESRLTGIEDEVVQSGNNMLLTFKNIAGDTFPRATRAMEDMAVAMNGGNLEGIDLKGTAIQLGKALNDPILGITALTRVGVSFTKEQKESIKAMVEMNDIAGAQAVILDELESEFGGAAVAAGDTFQGDVAKLKNELGNLGEIVGAEVIPSLADLAAHLTKVAIETQNFSADLADHKAGIVDTDQTYEEYLATLEEFRKRSGRGANAIHAMSEEEFNARQESENMIDTRRESIEQLEEIETSTDDYSIALEDNEAAAEAAKGEQNRLKEAFSALQTIIDGPVSDAYESFKTKQDELGEKVELLRAKIFILEQAEYLTDAQAEELENMQGELHESEAALVELALQHEDTIERMIFGMAAEALARDGWQSGEIEALTALGLKWGIYDEATAAAMLAVEGAVSGFNESGDMDTLISDLDAAARSAEDLSGTYNIDVVTTYKTIGTPSINPGGSFKGGKQHGGPVWGGEMYLVGEAGPELFMPDVSGRIIPNESITNNWNFNIHSSNPYPRLTEDYQMVRALAGA